MEIRLPKAYIYHQTTKGRRRAYWVYSKDASKECSNQR